MRENGVRPVERVMESPSAEKWWFGVERKWWLVAALGIANLMASLDGSVVNTSLPLIMRSFGGPLSSIEWVMMAYLLTTVSLLLTFGRLGDILGHKRIYVCGFGVFILGSALCGVAPSVWWLVAFRALQAGGAAMLMANSAAILTNAFPANQRGQALGLTGTAVSIGLMLGPSLGGYISDRFGWPWIFYINVPIGIVATLLALLVIPASKSAAQRREGFDPAGTITVGAGMTLLLLGLSHGQDWGWSSPTVIVMLGLALVLLVTFVWIERRVRFPMLDLNLFGNRLFSAANSATLIIYICVYSVTFMMPFYLLQGRGFTPTTTGLLISGMPLAMAVVAPFSGALSDRVGSRLPSSLGMAITTLGLVALALIGPDTTNESLLLRLMLVGLGVGIFVSPNISAILGSVPPQQRGVASGIASMGRNAGMVMGVAIAGAVFNAGLARWTPVAPDMALFNSIREAFIAAAAVGAIGTVVSLMRGPKSPLAGRPGTN